MADNNNDETSAAEDDRTSCYVDTKIERLQSDNSKECLFNITFNDFEALPSEIGRRVSSSMFSCFGSQWRVIICPGGDHMSSLDGMVAVYLKRCTGGRNLSLKFSFELDDGSDWVRRKGISIFTDLGLWGTDIWGWYDLCSRKEITGSEEVGEGFLVKGALTIRVSMQLDEFIPKNPASSIMLKMFDDEKSADVVFEICEQQKFDSESNRKRAKILAGKLYHAHRLILQHYSPELSALCATSDGMTPIIITDVKPEVFRLLLYSTMFTEERSAAKNLWIMKKTSSTLQTNME